MHHRPAHRRRPGDPVLRPAVAEQPARRRAWPGMFDCPVHGGRRSACPDGRFRVVMTPPLDLPRDAQGRIDVEGANIMVHGMVEQWIRRVSGAVAVAARPLALQPERAGQGKRRGVVMRPRMIRFHPAATRATFTGCSRRLKPSSRPSTGGNRSTPPPSSAASAGCCAPAGFAIVTELPLATGRRADVVGLSPSRRPLDRRDQIVDRGFPRRPQMAGIPLLLRPPVLRHPRRGAGRDLPRGCRADPRRRLWRRTSSARRRSTGLRRRHGRRCSSASPRPRRTACTAWSIPQRANRDS